MRSGADRNRSRDRRWVGDRGRGWVAALMLAGLVAAAPAAQAAVLPFTGSLSLLLGSFGVGIPGSGVATVNGSGGFGHLDSIAIPAGAFAAQGLTVSITTPAAYPLRGIQVTAANEDGSFTKPGPGRIGISGEAKVCLFGPCSGPVANLVVPLDVVGVGGTTYVTGAVNVTVVGAPWTSGTAAIGASTAHGHAYGPDLQTSSTARASGVLQLVTPIFISTNLAGDFAAVPAFGVLNLHFVPEPTTLLLVGAGLFVTAALGRR
jgi:hypothetical protein